MSTPNGNPGDIHNWPILKIVYRTDPEKLAALLPPGIKPGKDPLVKLNIYNYPVPDEPELGILTTVNADFNGIEGEYALGYGIDQESAIFSSQEINGQPKYPCNTSFYREQDRVVARCTHHGYTFFEFEGKSIGVEPNLDDFTVNEWWIKVSRAVGSDFSDMSNVKYDFPPHVVHVKSVYGTVHLEKVEGKIRFLESPWDPYATRLPMRELVSANLWWAVFKERSIAIAGELDPKGFAPFSDVIGGSRWPGFQGGPLREDCFK